MPGKLLPVFRDNVERLMIQKDWGRSELAAEMNVTRSYITQVLGGHRGVALAAIDRFAEALGVEPTALVTPPVVKPKRRAKAS